jgi:hypothetical protein
MTMAEQLAVEVHFVPIAAKELEERRARLRALLLRGALRFVHQHTDCHEAEESQTIEALPAVGAMN